MHTELQKACLRAQTEINTVMKLIQNKLLLLEAKHLILGICQNICHQAALKCKSMALTDKIVSHGVVELNPGVTA